MYALAAASQSAHIYQKIGHVINEGIKHSFSASTGGHSTGGFYALYMEQLVGELINCLGMAERILLTPVPASYSRHTSRFLSLYCLTLPLVLVPQLEFYTIPVMGAMCWGLFSIEEIGHLIEEPFSVSTKQLPLERMSANIGRDVKRLMRVSENESPECLDEDLLAPEDRVVAELAATSAGAAACNWDRQADNAPMLVTAHAATEHGGSTPATTSVMAGVGGRSTHGVSPSAASSFAHSSSSSKTPPSS